MRAIALVLCLSFSLPTFADEEMYPVAKGETITAQTDGAFITTASARSMHEAFERERIKAELATKKLEGTHSTGVLVAGAGITLVVGFVVGFLVSK